MEITERIEGMKKDFKMMCKAENQESAKSFFLALGVDEDSAKELLKAFKDMKDNQEVVDKTYERTINSKSGVDFSTDISKNQQRLFDSEQYFESIINKYALLSVANSPNLELSQIDTEFFDMLSENGITEQQITNPGLKIVFHLYTENKEQKNKIESLERKNSNLELEVREADDRISQLRRAYEKLQSKFRDRIVSAEKHYQAALAQIATLEGKVNELQNKGILKTIGSKLTGIFKNKKKELPEASSEIPRTLYDSGAEKMGLVEYSEEVEHSERSDSNIPVAQRDNNGR